MRTGKIALLLVSISLFLTSCSNLDIQKLNQRALELMNAGNVDGAIARLESINDLNPGFPETYYNLGIAYYKKGNYDKAIEALNNAVKLNNAFTDAYYSLGVIYEDYALTVIDKTKNLRDDNKSIQLVVDNLKQSQEAYKQYLEISKESDRDSIQSKIELLDQDITKYENLLPANPNSDQAE